MTSRFARRPSRSVAPGVDALEPRRVPTTSNSSYLNSVAKHAYDQFVSELSRIELASGATTAEYLALRDDARALSGAVSASGPAAHAPTAQGRVVSATLLVDRSLLQGWLGDQGWVEIRSLLARDLAPFPVDPSLLDKAVADMRAAAASALVDPGSYQILTEDIASVQAARDQLRGGTSTSSFRDPQVYYTQHLRGFFRDFGRQRVVDEARLRSDLAAIAHGSSGEPARDVALLEQLGAAIPSDADQTLTDAFAADSGDFRTVAISALGGTATPTRVASVDRLAADAPAFAAAAGSPEAVHTLLADVRAVTDDGEGASPNPFLIVIRPAAGAQR